MTQSPTSNSSGLVRALAVIALFPFLTAFCFGSDCESWHSPDELKNEIRQLDLARKTAAHGVIPSGWDAALFISAGTLNSLLSSFEGVKANLTSPHAQLRVDEVHVVPDYGRTEVDLRLTATVPGSSLALGLTISADLTYRRLQAQGDGGDPRAIFGLEPTRIKPELTLGFLSAGASGLMSQLIASGTARLFAKTLEFAAPLALKPHLRIGFPMNANGANSVRKTLSTGSEGGSVTLITSMAESDIAPERITWVPLAIPGGIWLLATVGGAVSMEPPVLLQDDSHLEQQRQQMKVLVENALRRVSTPSQDLAVWLNKSVFFSILDQFNKLSDERRTLVVTSESPRGFLVKKVVKIVGSVDGGYSVNLAGAQPINGQIHASKAEGLWTAASGLTVSLQASAHASADVRLHVDPFITGGADTTMTISATAPTYMHQERLVLERLRAPDGDAVLLGNVPRCDQLPLDLETGGDIKFGVRTFQNVGTEAGAPLMLIDPLPHYALLEVKTEQISVAPTWMETRAVVRDFTIERDGYWVTASVSIQRHDVRPDESGLEARHRRLQEALTSQWMARWKPSCPAPREPIYLFAGAEFGPNNEVVKGVRAIVTAVNRTNENIVLTWDRITTVAKDPSKTPQVAAETLKDLGTAAVKVGQQVGDILGHGVEQINKILPHPHWW